MSKIEELTAASLEADHEMERQSGILRGLERELERDATSLSCADYMNLHARTAQQRERVRLATEKAVKLQRQTDALRSATEAADQREAAQRKFDSRLAELNMTRAEIAAKQQAIRDLQNGIPALVGRQQVLLYELDRARTALEHLPQHLEVSA